MGLRSLATAALAGALTWVTPFSARAQEACAGAIEKTETWATTEGRSKPVSPSSEHQLAERAATDVDAPVWGARPHEVVPIEPLLAPAPLPLPPDRSEHPKHLLVGVLETALLLGSGSYWYWGEGAPRSEKSDMHFDWSSWKKKLDLGAVRFDDDRFETNAASHPTAGMGYFQIARGNGFSYAQSYLWVFVSSFLWEYFVEWNEKPSINDIILTPAGGAVLGESTFRLGRFFASGEPTIVNRAGALLLSPFAELNDLVIGHRQASAGPYDTFGFTGAMRHRLALSIEMVSAVLEGKQSDNLAFGFDTFLVTHPSYRRPGDGAVTVGPGEWTGLGARVLYERDAGIISGVNVHSDTLVVGRYLRHYAPRDPGETWRTARPRGVGLLLGLGSAFDYRTRLLEPGTDRLASAGLLGPRIELDVDRGWFGARAALASYYSFAIVQSLAYMVHGDPAGALTINTALHKQSYYYGHGISSVGSVALRLGDVELGVAAAFATYWSINGRDRYQEQLQADLSVSDQLASGAASISYSPWGAPVMLAGRLESIHRSGQLSGTSASIGETRVGVGAGLVF